MEDEAVKVEELVAAESYQPAKVCFRKEDESIFALALWANSH